MLLFIAFGIYVIVTKKVYITRTWILTGENARNFGFMLVALPIPVSVTCRTYLPYVLPPSIVYHPIGGRMAVLVVLTVVLFVLAFMFRDKPSRVSVDEPPDHKPAV